MRNKSFLKISRRSKVILGLILFFLILYYFCLPRQLFDVSYSTVVYDRNGELLGARVAEDQQWRFPVSATLPDKYKHCLITFEDQYYNYHWGVNPLAIIRAGFQNGKAKRVVSGGSTITMQTIRLSRNNERSLKEKFIEMILATRLEFRYSKRSILSLYASHAPFGGNVVGIEAASWRYFGHEPAQLSWAEAATLAVLPNAPSLIHLSKNRKQLLQKRNRLLAKLYEKKMIDRSDYELAISEELPQEPIPMPQLSPHVVTHFYHNFNGEQTTTTIDKDLQLQVEQLLQRWHDEFQKSDIRNMAALVIDVADNEVVAYCGNVGFLTRLSGSQVDIIHSPRSTGSILKPFLYCAALQDGSILPEMLMADIPLNFNGFSPQNFNLQFDGAVPASEALSRSLNVPAVLLLRNYGVPRFYDFLKKAGMTTLHRPPSHYGLSLILGGAEATLWDITSLYTDMARVLLNKESSEIQLVKDVGDKPEKQSPFRSGAVWQIFQALKETERPEEIDWRTTSSMQPIAWKTGTSYGFRDAWAVGVTPQFVVAVWVGNANGEGKAGLIGNRTAAPVMFDIFNLLPTSRWFEIPSGVMIDAEVCPLSGHLKGRFCNDTDTVPILFSGMKSSPCPYHIRVNLTEDERFLVNEYCIGEEDVIEKNWFVLPPAWAWFYKQRNSFYQPLPPYKPGCSGFSGMPMQFIYPQGNAHITLSKQIDGTMGELTLELAHNSSDATVFWHIDDCYITSTRDFHQISLHPSPGKHTITVVDQHGNTLSIQITVSDQ